MRAPYSTTPLVFGLERSVYTRIARMALEEKGVPYGTEEVEIFGPTGVPAEHLQRHPFGRIPVLKHGAFLLYETSAITRYVDELFDSRPLQPLDGRERARMGQIIGILDSYAYRPMVWGVFVQRVRIPMHGGTPDEAVIADSLTSSRKCLAVLEELLGSTEFLSGSALSLADLHAYPMLRYFMLAPEGQALLERHPKLAQWYERMRVRPSALKTIGPYERQLAI